jgi:hypothetical protein
VRVDQVTGGWQASVRTHHAKDAFAAQSNLCGERSERVVSKHVHGYVCLPSHHHAGEHSTNFSFSLHIPGVAVRIQNVWQRDVAQSAMWAHW